MLDRIKNEPVLMLNAVLALLALYTAFGGQLTGEQSEAIAGVASVAVAILGGAYVRSQVTPVNKFKR